MMNTLCIGVDGSSAWDAAAAQSNHLTPAQVAQLTPGATLPPSKDGKGVLCLLPASLGTASTCPCSRRSEIIRISHLVIVRCSNATACTSLARHVCTFWSPPIQCSNCNVIMTKRHMWKHVLDNACPLKCNHAVLQTACLRYMSAEFLIAAFSYHNP